MGCLYRNVSRPAEHGQARLWRWESGAVGFHNRLRQILALGGCPQQCWLEIAVFLQHKRFPARGADELHQARKRSSGPGCKGPGIQQDKAFDALWMPRGKTQSHRSTPIVEDEGNIAHIQDQHEGLEVS